MATATKTKKRTTPNSQANKAGVTNKLKATPGPTEVVEVAKNSIVNLYNIDKVAISGKVIAVHGGLAIDVVVVPKEGENYTLSSIPHISNSTDEKAVFWN